MELHAFRLAFRLQPTGSVRAVRPIAVLVGLVIASGAASAGGGSGAKAQTGTNGSGKAAGYASAVKQALRYRRQVQKARKELSSVDHGPLKRAISSFGNPSVAPAERRRLLSEASGAPLTNSALAIARGLAGFVPRGAFERAGRASKRGMGEAKSAVKTRWWGNFVPEDLSETGRALDSLAEAVEKPEFRGQLDTALNVLRVAGRIEADNLSRLSGRIPEENMAAVEEAVSRYAADMAGEVVDATSGGTLDPTAKAATGRLVGGLFDIARTLKATAGQPDHVRDAAIASEVVRLRKDLDLTSKQARKTVDRVAANGSLEAVNWARLTKRAAVHNRRLQRTLSASLDMSPEARQAAAALSKDAELTGKFALGTARIIGAASNTNMKPRERAAVVKEAAESMGPIFIKMVQTIINKSGTLEEFGLGGSPDDAVILYALSELQDKVTPMAENVLRAQMRKSLGGKEIEAAFAEFDMTPIKSASIAQVHRAKVWVRRPPFFKKKLIEVAVKVQRPNLEADMKDAVRAVRLAMAVSRESLRAFDLAGKVDIDPAKIGKGLDLVDNTLADFIRSFAIETDFKIERKHMRRMARLVKNEKDIYVPKVYEKHSGELVITMDFVRGDKLSEPPKPAFEGEEPEPEEVTYVRRAARAQAAQAAGPAATGALPDDPAAAEAEASRRASDHAVRTWGLDPIGLEVSRRQDGGFDAVARFDHDAQPKARFRIHKDGRIQNLSTAPDLSKVGVAELRDRMIGSFVNHAIVNRFLHGDIHRGNFRILADGKTIALFDFGQMVKLKPMHFTAPAMFALGAWRKNTGRMAKAIVKMSDQYASLSRSQRGDAEKALKEALDAALSQGDGKLSPDVLFGALVAGTAKAGLTLASVYPQLLKTSWAMWGNLGDAEKHSGPMNGRTVKRVAGRLGAAVVSKPIPISTAIHILKRRRVERILRESRPD